MICFDDLDSSALLNPDTEDSAPIARILTAEQKFYPEPGEMLLGEDGSGGNGGGLLRCEEEALG